MDQLNQERRGLFDGLRVPFDPNMLLLAVACVGGYLLLMWLTHLATGDVILGGDPPVLVAFFLGQKVPWHGITYVLVVAISAAFWSFFSTAISRIAAMKIAREETLSLKEACTFAAKKFFPVLSSVAIVAALLFALYFVVNASIFGGAIGRIPYAGEVLVSLLFPITLIVTFFFTFALVLGLFGFNLGASAIATESSDTWDGISRSWQYLLARPWHVLLTYALTAAYLAVFVFFAGKFLDWSIDSLSVGWWGMGENTKIATRAVENLPKDLKAMAPEGEKEVAIALPGKVEFLRNYANGKYESSDGTTVVEYAVPFPERDAVSKKTKLTIINLQRKADVTDLLPGTLYFGGTLVWFWLWICKLAVSAFAVQYVFGATTMLYFLLRKEVEGEDYGEIVVEEEELAEEASWEVKEPAKPAPGAPAPAGELVMPGKMPANSGSEEKAPPAAPAAPPAAAPAASGTAPPSEGEKN
jgi:hypothetical protein